MRKKDVNGILHDLLELDCWWNPSRIFFIDKRVEINLLTGNCSDSSGSTLAKLLQSKREWFVDRVLSLGGCLEDFEKAVIIVYGTRERIEFIYKGEEFCRDFVVEDCV